MKKAVTVEVMEVENEGLISLLGKKIEIFCGNYIYAGTLEGVNTTCIKLKEDCGIVFETGPFSSKNYKDFQKLGHAQYIQTAFIESFGETTKEF